MDLPSAIIFINSDINDLMKNTLITQLEINDYITFDEFNARVAADPNYTDVIHLNKIRVMVVLPTFQDYTNRTLADIVLFLKAGLATVEKNNFGPPKLSLPLQRLNIWNLIYGINHQGIASPGCPPNISPDEIQTAENPKPHFHLDPHFPEGMGVLQLYGTEALQNNGMDEGMFGDPLSTNHNDDDDD